MNISRRIFIYLVFVLGTLPNIGYAQTQVEVWTSTPDLSHQLSAGESVPFKKRVKRKSNIVVVDDTKEFQHIEGLGSSFEPTTCFNLSRLPEAERRKAIRRIVHL